MNKTKIDLNNNLILRSENIEYDESTLKSTLDNRFNYSTEEQKIGKWIDGKPLYRKVIDCGNLPNTSSKTVNTSISNIDMVTNIYGSASNGLIYYHLPHTSRWDSESCIQIAYLKTNNVLELVTGSDRSSLYAYVILEYTKTTD